MQALIITSEICTGALRPLKASTSGARMTTQKDGLNGNIIHAKLLL